jgi:hypothetical protein
MEFKEFQKIPRLRRDCVITEKLDGTNAQICIVPVLYTGIFNTNVVDETINKLKEHGSYIVPFMNPEGIVIYLTASRQLYKQTLENDDKPKTK